jgi:hypothetical protein
MENQMKKIIVLGAAVVLLGGGYTGLWHYNANHLKQEMRADAPANMKIPVFEQLLSIVGKDVLSYGSVETSGFPGAISLDFKDVNLKIANVFKAHMDSYHIKRSISSNTFTDSVDGDVTITAGPFAENVPATELVVKFAPGNKGEIQFKGSQLTNFLTGKLSMDPFHGKSGSWALLNDFESLEGKTTGFEIADKKSGKALMKSAGSDFKLTAARLDPLSHKISLQYKSTDSEITPEFDTYVQTVGKSLMEAAARMAGTPLQQSDMSVFSLMKFSVAGKTNTEIDVSYKGVTDFTGFEKSDNEIDLEINKLDSTNKLSTSKAQGRVNIKFKKAIPQEGLVKFDTTFRVTAEYIAFIRNLYKEMGKTISEQEAKGNIQEKDADTQRGLFLMKNMDQIVPDLDKQGDIKFGMDIKFDVDKKSATINNYSLVTDKYGFIVKGSGNFADMAKPDGYLDISLKNHTELVSDLFDYVTKMVDLFKQTEPAMKDFTIDPALKKVIDEFLVKIAEKSADGSKDLLIKLSIKGDKVKIGTMEAAEAAMTLMMMFAPQPPKS